MGDPFPEPSATRRGRSRRPAEDGGQNRRGSGGRRDGGRRDKGRRGGEGLDWLEAPREKPAAPSPEPPADEPAAMFTPPPRAAQRPPETPGAGTGTGTDERPPPPSRRSLRAEGRREPPTPPPGTPAPRSGSVPRIDPAMDAVAGGRPGRPRPRPVEDLPEPPPRRRSHGIGLILVALALVAWSLTCLVEVASPAVAAAAALSPAITVLAVPVVALGVGRRHPVPAALATLAAAVPWVLVAGYGAAGPGPTSEQAGTPLRMILVDANDGRADAERVADLARDYAADVVVVTELTDALAHDLTIGGLSIPAQYVGDGIGIWARDTLGTPAAVDGLSRPAASGVLQVGRPAGGVTPLTTGPAQEVGILVAHAESGTSLLPATGRLSDLDNLGDHAPKVQRRIVLGDLDATPWNPAFRRLATDDWRDAADVVGRGLRPTWPSWSPLPVSPLDHVLVSGGLGVSGVDTANVPGTDHRALIVTVVVPDD